MTAPRLSQDHELKHILVLDFEATCAFDVKGWPNEIIEFPTLAFDLETNSVTHVFHEYVKPVVNPELTDFCTELTGIEQSTVDAADTFIPVWDRFLKFLDTHGFTEENANKFVFLTCGDWDFKTMLPKQIAISSTPDNPLHLDIRFRRWFNLKVQFPLVYPDKRRMVA
ncbi:hypothetical protein M422DRAFT_250675 [Sphaerobolus stellatus SS14]|uniref:Exonuclease domain-containing protein n=1 Tax=Sphaerobolus stellatus (strain SS14) TaxID=990650 RepID=A0A0C9VFZ4_SPHS4|nr:hypothetical protein M422DRAFT_250675 [Sphaerobolus stellatus SS14]